jgi:excisionase family DNA binding protein
MIHEQLTTGDAARVSGLSVATIKRKIQAKELNAIRSGTGEWKVTHADLMAFLSAQKPPKRQSERKLLTAHIQSEPFMNRSLESFERELNELKQDKIRLETRLVKVEEEKHALEMEYKAFVRGQLEEKESELKKLKEERSQPNKAKEAKPISERERSGVPTRFLHKLMTAAKSFQEA